MRLRVCLEPQEGATYEDQLAVARTAEDAGYDGLFRSDHYLPERSVPRLDPTDAWMTLAGLARETSRIRLGTLVSAATFRQPAVLAISVAQVQAMSGGRAELGLGTGWYEAEHRAYGLPFPGLAGRFVRLEEQLQIVTGLWSASGRFSFRGQYYQLTDAPPLLAGGRWPAPPVVVGGLGRDRTPRLAARYADEYNVPHAPMAVTAELFRLASAAAAGAGRAVRLSAAQELCIGRSDAEVRQRAEAAGRDIGELRQHAVTGSADEAADRLGQLAAVGAGTVYLTPLQLSDVGQLEFVAERIAPQLASAES
jgi:F420-dependent oxidoreductase-like protein